jgi:hypothetical protein
VHHNAMSATTSGRFSIRQRKKHSVTGAPARFSGRVGRLKIKKDSARSAEKIFCFAHPRSESAHPEIETQGGQAYKA